MNHDLIFYSNFQHQYFSKMSFLDNEFLIWYREGEFLHEDENFIKKIGKLRNIQLQNTTHNSYNRSILYSNDIVL